MSTVRDTVESLLAATSGMADATEGFSDWTRGCWAGYADALRAILADLDDSDTPPAGSPRTALEAPKPAAG